MRFKSKPVDTVYLDALHDKKSDTYHVHEVDVKGKPVGDKGVFSLSGEEVAAGFDLIPARGPSKKAEPAS